jgi:hypothetical protein
MREKITKLIEGYYGPITWGGAIGWGEGLITCSIVKEGENVMGVSYGDCTSLEALIDLASKLNIKLEMEI